MDPKTIQQKIVDETNARNAEQHKNAVKHAVDQVAASQRSLNEQLEYYVRDVRSSQRQLNDLLANPPKPVTVEEIFGPASA